MKNRFLFLLLVFLSTQASFNIVLGAQSHPKHEKTITVETSPTGVGKVYVGNNSARPANEYKDNQSSFTTDCGGNEAYCKPTIYLGAQTKDNNYLFSNWEKDGSSVSTEPNCSISVDLSSNNTDKYTAKWIQPKVNSVNAPSITVTNPSDRPTDTLTYALSEDKAADNYTFSPAAESRLSCGATAYSSGKYEVPVTYTPSGIHAVNKYNYTLTSNYGGSTKTSTITITEDYTPTFTLSQSSLDFGTIDNTSNKTLPLAAPTSKSWSCQQSKCTWSASLSGANADKFSVSALAADGSCSVSFIPQNAIGTFSASLQLTSTYTDAANNPISHTQTISLTATSELPQVPTLTIANQTANPGSYDLTTQSYTFLNQYGTATKTASFVVSYLNTTAPTISLSNASPSNFWSISEGTEFNDNGLTAKIITITAHATTAVTDTTACTAQLVVSANSTSDNVPLSQTLSLDLTLLPKQANTLALALRRWSDGSFYYIFTDDSAMPLLRDVNNTTTPITITPSTNLSSYISIDDSNPFAPTIAPLAHHNSNIAVTISQPETDEFLAANLSFKFRVRKHDIEWIYPQGICPTQKRGNVLFRNHSYPVLLTTNSIQSGEVTSATFTATVQNNYTDRTVPQIGDPYGPRITTNTDGTLAISVGDTMAIHNASDKNYWGYDIIVNAKVPESANYYASNLTTGNNITFNVTNDPLHVSLSPDYVYNTVGGRTEKIYYGKWGNNGSWQFGRTFVTEKYNATWIGYDWVDSQKENPSSMWSGTHTGRTDWTTVAKQGSGNCYALENNGYVVFKYEGVASYIHFNKYFQTANSDGTLSLQESADGTTWTDATPEGTATNYLTNPGYTKFFLKPQSHYIKVSYTGTNHIVIQNTTIYLDNYLHTSFTPNHTSAAYVYTGTAPLLTTNSDNSWQPYDFTLNVANYRRPEDFKLTSSNPDFIVEFTNSTSVPDGLDHYEQIPMRIRYVGSKLVDQSTITISTKSFYYKSNLKSDTIRSLQFKVIAKATNHMPQTITAANKTIRYLTGTDGPIRNTKSAVTKKWELKDTEHLYSRNFGDNPHNGYNTQDFTSCFAEDGTPLFDRLYIFGVTTNNDGTTETYDYYYRDQNGDTVKARGTFEKISNPTSTAPSNAVTPCYVYRKNGNSYTLDDTIPNMNVATKPIPVISASGKYYFSGHCPMGSIGTDANANGVLHFQGTSSTSIDVYLENCNIIARHKGDNATEVEHKFKVNQYVTGSASAIVFQATDNSTFSPKIHFKGDNYLRSNQGNKIVVTVLFITKTAVQSSGTIHLLCTDENKKHNLTIDDLWPTTTTSSYHCNGSVILRKKTNQSPAIDLGNPNSVVTFNGGQIDFCNAVPTSTAYETTNSISCRKYEPSEGIALYGMGADYDGGTIYFNDGTFSTKEIDVSTYSTYFHDGISIKCPSKTYVNGGTYNVSIWATDMPSNKGKSPTNQLNDAVVFHVLPATSIDSATGLCSITFPNDLIVEDSTDEHFGETLSEYYTRNNIAYGQQSICPNDTGYVRLYLPAKYTGKKAVESEINTTWAITSASLTAGMAGINQNLGGDTEISFGKKGDVTYRTAHYLHAVVNQAMAAAVVNTDYKTPLIPGISLPAQGSITKITSPYYGNVTNTDSYEIDEKIYYMSLIMADQWMTFCPPFDISNVYIFDIYPFEALSKVARTQAMDLLYRADMDLAFAIAYPIAKEAPTGDLDALSNKYFAYAYGLDTTSGLYPREGNVNANGYYPRSYTQAKGYTANYRGKTKLIPYDGTNPNVANFYIYRSDSTWRYDGSNYTTDWVVFDSTKKVIGDTERDILMRKGEVYALQFPYCPGCDDFANRQYHDYWSGKFILFEGYGPQTIDGKNTHSSIHTPFTDPGKGVLRGNATFAANQLPNFSGATGELTNVYMQKEKTNTFQKTTTQKEGILPPGGVFLLANPQGPSNKVAKVNVFTGEVQYEEDLAPLPLPSDLQKPQTLIVGSDKGELIITPLTPQFVTVFTASGQLLYQSYLTDRVRLVLPQGLYLVRGESDEAKAIVQ